jgi:hypothetical protein
MDQVGHEPVGAGRTRLATNRHGFAFIAVGGEERAVDRDADDGRIWT